MSADGSTLFLRDARGQVPGGDDPGGAWTASPDIAPMPTPMTDPGQFATSDSYDTQPGATLQVGRTNFVYVRGLYTPGPTGQARVWLFHVASELALWPETWSGDGIAVNGSPQNWIDVNGGTGRSIAVTNPPFTFQVPTPEPGQSIQLIAFAESPPYHDPSQWKPTPTDPFPTNDALAGYVRDHHGIAWLGTVEEAGDAPTADITEPVAIGSDTRPFWIGFVCENMPANGGRAAVALPGPDEAGTVSSPPLDITSPDSVRMFLVTWPAGYESAVTITYWMGDTAPTVGAMIQPSIRPLGAGESPDVPPDASQVTPIGRGIGFG